MSMELISEFSEQIRTGTSLLAIVVVALIIYIFVARLTKVAERKQSVSPPVAGFIRKLTAWTVSFVGALAVLQVFGVLEHVLTAIVAVLALVAIGFVAVWSIMSNALCALLILITRPFRIGDEISLVGEAVSGKVVDLNLLHTTLHAENGELFQIPNNYFFQKPISRKLGDTDISLWEQLRSDKRHKPE